MQGGSEGTDIPQFTAMDDDTQPTSGEGEVITVEDDTSDGFMDAAIASHDGKQKLLCQAKCEEKAAAEVNANNQSRQHRGNTKVCAKKETTKKVVDPTNVPITIRAKNLGSRMIGSWMMNLESMQSRIFLIRMMRLRLGLI